MYSWIYHIVHEALHYETDLRGSLQATPNKVMCFRMLDSATNCPCPRPSPQESGYQFLFAHVALLQSCMIVVTRLSDKNALAARLSLSRCNRRTSKFFDLHSQSHLCQILLHMVYSGCDPAFSRLSWASIHSMIFAILCFWQEAQPSCEARGGRN